MEYCPIMTDKYPSQLVSVGLGPQLMCDYVCVCVCLCVCLCVYLFVRVLVFQWRLQV